MVYKISDIFFSSFLNLVLGKYEVPFLKDQIYAQNSDKGNFNCYLYRIKKCLMKRVFNVREIIQILIGQGWYLARQNGTSHRQFKHPNIKRTVTVDGKLSQDVLIANLKSMEKQSGLKFKDFVD